MEYIKFGVWGVVFFCVCLSVCAREYFAEGFFASSLFLALVKSEIDNLNSDVSIVNTKWTQFYSKMSNSVVKVMYKVYVILFENWLVLCAERKKKRKTLFCG